MSPTRMGSPHRGDYGHLEANQVGSQRRQLIVLKLRPTEFDRQIAAFDITNFVQSLDERIGHILCLARRPGAEITDRRQRRLLRARRERPGSGTADQRDELAPFHYSITSSARPSSVHPDWCKPALECSVLILRAASPVTRTEKRESSAEKPNLRGFLALHDLKRALG